MEKRSLFKMIFGSKKSIPVSMQQLQLLNGYTATFTDYDGKIYDSVDVRNCIDRIATNAAKLHPIHIRETQNGIKGKNTNIQRIIAEKPNELMNAYDFYYKVVSELFLANNAFIYILRDDSNNCIGLYPITHGKYDLLEYKGHVFIQFRFGNGEKHVADIEDVIHLKRMFCQDEVFGGNNNPIKEVLSIKHVIDEGIVNTIKTTQAIRGVLKSTKAILKPEDTKKMRDNFVRDFMDSEDGTGIGALDATTDFNSINLNPQSATDSQVKEYDQKIMRYFGINENILTSKYSEDEWNAFYESVIEPIGLMMSLEFTNKIFSYGEKYHGNKIVFESNRLAYASNNTKVNVAKEMTNFMMIDEIREMFNLPPLPNGEGQKVLQDLNHINSQIADEYQVGNKDTQEQPNEL